MGGVLNGGRLFFREKDDQVEISGKSRKENQKSVIDNVKKTFFALWKKRKVSNLRFFNRWG